MLRLIDVFHSYSDFKNDHNSQNWVLKNVFYEFKSDTYALTGPSGIGKSTFLNLLGGLIKPRSGKVENTENISFIFQNPSLLSDLTLKENIEIAAQIKGKKVQYDEIVELLGIGEILDRFPNQVSGGQKQRAAIARSLVTGAKFILADEPTGNLDQENADTVRKLFSLIHKELRIGFLVSTHDLAWLNFCNHHLTIENHLLKEVKKC